MKKMKEEKIKMKKDLEVGGVEWYRRKIVDMIGQVENIKFLNQIFTILKKHINIKKEGISPLFSYFQAMLYQVFLMHPEI